MKSIIRFIPSNCSSFPAIVILAFILISSVHCSPSCGLYGAPPCRYLPAPPGQTPSCARPGKTYCEHVDNYPAYLIKHLVHKWGYEAKNLIVDETWEDFAAIGWRNTPVFYDPAFIFPQYQKNFNENRNEFSGYDYNSPASGAAVAAVATSAAVQSHGGPDENFSSNPNFFLSQQQQTTPTPTSASQQLNNKNSYPNGQKVTPNNPTFWLKRVVRDLSLRSSSSSNHNISSSISSATSSLSSSSSSSRDVSLNMDLLEIMGVENESSASSERASRVKRQSAGRSTLCQTTSQFVAPQAALNSKGNWMFVVNEPSTAHQLVKAELCASNTCSNLCQLPNGYNSRCEQKYAQKRLVALQANGQNLYTDTFWFPSCCVCTISSN